MSAPLFRIETNGSIKTSSPLLVGLSFPQWVGAIGSAFILVALILLITFGTYGRKVLFRGEIIPIGGMVKIYGGETGVLVRKLAQSNQVVRKGDPLYVISSDKFSMARGSLGDSRMSSLKEKERLLESKQQTLTEIRDQQSRDMASKVESLRRELKSAAGLLRLRKERLQVVVQNLKGQSTLVEKGFMSIESLKLREIEKLEAEGQVLESERDIERLQGDLSDLMGRMEVMRLQHESEKSKISADLQDLHEDLSNKESVREYSILSPTDGIIGDSVVEVGQRVSPGILLGTVIPSNRLTGIAYIPAKHIGAIENAKELKLRYEAYPYQRHGQFSASISAISKSSLNGDDVNFGEKSDKLYRISLLLTDESSMNAIGPVTLRSGMTFEASVVVDKRRLYQWIFDSLKIFN